MQLLLCAWGQSSHCRSLPPLGWMMSLNDDIKSSPHLAPMQQVGHVSECAAVQCFPFEAKHNGMRRKEETWPATSACRDHRP
jgi:hypothetical protein